MHILMYDRAILLLCQKMKKIRGLQLSLLLSSISTNVLFVCFCCSAAVHPSVSLICRFRLFSDCLHPSSPGHFFVLMCDLITCLIEVVAAHRLDDGEMSLVFFHQVFAGPFLYSLNKLLYSHAVNYICGDAVRFVSQPKLI